MKQFSLAAILAALLVASPALAAVSPLPGHVAVNKLVGSELADVAVGESSTKLARESSAALPLECRGYYVRKLHHGVGLSRCE